MGLNAGDVRKSTDNGATWSSFNSGLTDLRILALAMDASGPQTVYAGTFGGGLFKTSDGGATWANVAAASPISLAADPNRPGTIYAAVFQNLTNGMLRKSSDGGATWTTVFVATAPIWNITIDPGNSDIVYAGSIGHGAIKSTDAGQHWSPISELTPSAVWTLALDPRNSQVLYAGTNDDGVWKSSDAGATWQQLGLPGSAPVYSLVIDGSTAHTIYAGTGDAGVQQSSDDGKTWRPSGLAGTGILSLVGDSAGTLYAATKIAGALVSRHPASWTDLDPGIRGTNKFIYGLWIDPSNGQKIFVSSPAEFGLLWSWSDDSGVTWSIPGLGFTGRGSRGLTFDPSNHQRIYAGGTVGDGLFKSEDGGRTWSRRRFGSAAVYVIPVAVDAVSPNNVYAGTQNEGLFKSIDYGDTWNPIGTGLSGAITGLSVDPSTSGRLFAATGMAFYLSEDGGQTWTNILNKPAWTITITTGMPSTVYATTRTQGVYRSLDAGDTWQEINTGLTSLSMGRNAPVIVDPGNAQILYVGTEGAGVFKSRDGGDHWFTVNSGVDELSVYGLAMDPADASVLLRLGSQRHIQDA